MSSTSVESKMTLDSLILKLHELFEDTYVNVEEVQQTMESYIPVYEEWSKFAHFDPHRYGKIMGNQGNSRDRESVGNNFFRKYFLLGYFEKIMK